MIMKHYTLILTFILLLLCGRVSAQYESVDVKLYIHTFDKYLDSIVLKAHADPEVDSQMLNDYELYVNTWHPDSTKWIYYYDINVYHADERKARDTTLVITKEQYDHIAEIALSISSKEMMKGSLNTKIMDWCMPVGTKLNIDVLADHITYTIPSPQTLTEERGLTSYLELCKEMAQLAGLTRRLFK